MFVLKSKINGGLHVRINVLTGLNTIELSMKRKEETAKFVRIKQKKQNVKGQKTTYSNKKELKMYITYIYAQPTYVQKYLKAIFVNFNSSLVNQTEETTVALLLLLCNERGIKIL